MLASPHHAPAGCMGKLVAFPFYSFLPWYRLSFLTLLPSKAESRTPNQTSLIGVKALNLKYLKRIHLSQPTDSPRHLAMTSLS